MHPALHDEIEGIGDVNFSYGLSAWVSGKLAEAWPGQTSCKDDDVLDAEVARGKVVQMKKVWKTFRTHEASGWS